MHTASPHTPRLTKKILKNQDFALFSAKLRFVRFAVNTYSIAAHALSNEKISRNQDFALFSVKLRFVRFAVNTYSIAAHASSNEKNFTKSRFLPISVILCFVQTASIYIQHRRRQLALNGNCIFRTLYI